MRFTRIRIKNFKSIRDMELSDIDSALILVGKNNTGKTSVLDAVRLMTGGREVLDGDFDESGQNIEIETELKIEEEDLLLFHSQAVVSAYRRFEIWKRDFEKKLPSFQNGILSFTFLVNREGRKRFFDGFRKHNPYIAQVIPKLHYIDTVIQIFPETPFLDHFFQVLICTADDSHVDLHRFDTPHPFNLLLLQNAEQLGLEVQGHLADLVQQEGTVIGQLKFADFATLGRT